MYDEYTDFFISDVISLLIIYVITCIAGSIGMYAIIAIETGASSLEKVRAKTVRQPKQYTARVTAL